MPFPSLQTRLAQNKADLWPMNDLHSPKTTAPLSSPDWEIPGFENYPCIYPKTIVISVIHHQ